MAKTAILIDGVFYRKRARHLWGEKVQKIALKSWKRTAKYIYIEDE